MSEGYYPSTLASWKLRYAHQRPARLQDEAIDLGITQRDADCGVIPCRKLRDYMATGTMSIPHNLHWEQLRSVRPLSDRCLKALLPGAAPSIFDEELVDKEIKRATQEIKTLRLKFLGLA